MDNDDDLEDRRPVPIRPSVDIPQLRSAIRRLEERVKSWEQAFDQLERVVEAMAQDREQLTSILECGDYPVPIFLHWKQVNEEGRPVYQARFGKYLLDVVNGSSAVSWTLNEGPKMLEAGGGYTDVDKGFEEAEKALRREIQARALKRGGGGSR